MHQIEVQILRAALAELGGDISAHASHPLAQGKIHMTSFLLAYLLGRKDTAREYESIEEEVNGLQQADQEEQKILGKGVAREVEEPTITAELLTSYVRSTLGSPNATVTDMQVLLGGFSKQTYILSLSGADQVDNKLVLRCDLPGGPVESRAADEFPIIQLMHKSGVRVAEPLWADEHPPFNGTCLVMRAVAGKTAYDITGSTLGADSKDAAMALARVLGSIHRTPITALNLPAELANAPVDEHVRRMVKFYETQWQRRRISVSPTLEAAFAWLYANVPNNSVPSLVHGDASLRNLLVHEGKETAMLDWELWHVGDHNEDLAYCRIDVEQCVPWDVFMSEYRTHGGHEFDTRADVYYGIFGALRNAVFADACLHSFINAAIPEPKLAYGALAMGRKLICDIAARLRKAQ